MDLWKPNVVKSGACLHWQIGPLKIWVRRVGDEWHLATKRAPEDEETLVVAEPSPDSDEVEREWRRWVLRPDDRVIHFLPVMPDRPVIVRPESDLVIPAGGKALFFVSIPIWIRATAGEKTPVTLCEIPTVKLSKSWFGDPAAGELCYALRTKARRAVDALPARPYRAVCPVTNAARVELEFERLCVRVEHLKIFRGRTHLWTNPVNVTYHGEDDPTEIEFGSGPPTVDGANDLLSDSRRPATGGLLRKSFSTLRALSGI